MTFLTTPAECRCSSSCPDKGKFDDFDDSLTAGILDLVQKQWEERDVTLNMPRFEFESAHTLKETLERMGMPDAFESSADFSGITDEIHLQISDVFHKAFVSVDEKGHRGSSSYSWWWGCSWVEEIP